MSTFADGVAGRQGPREMWRMAIEKGRGDGL